MVPQSTVLTGTSGEHLVLGQLLAQGVIAALTPCNTPDIDILAAKDSRVAQIRVKTSGKGTGDWVWSVSVPEWMKAKYRSRRELTPKQWRIEREKCIIEAVNLTPFKNIRETGDSMVLVALSDQVEFYILPTLDVQETLQRGFECWIRTLGPRGERSVINWQRRIGLHDTVFTDAGLDHYIADTKNDWDALWPQNSQKRTGGQEHNGYL